MSRLLDTIPYKSILSLWFDRLKTKNFREAYFQRDTAFDTQCREFEPYIKALIEDEGRLETVERADSRDTVLACILLLDQYSRNIWRGKQAKDVYTRCDPGGQRLSNYYIERKWHKQDDWVSLAFVLLPLEHSEVQALHLKGVSIWTNFMSTVSRKEEDQASMIDLYFDSQLEHYRLIRRFGRYPHRVKANGGTLTEEETKYLAESGSQFGSDE